MSVCVCVWGTGKAAKITAQQTTLMSNSDNGQRTGGEGEGEEKRKGNGQRHRTCRQELARLEKAKQAACTVVPVALEMRWLHLEKIVSYIHMLRMWAWWSIY